MNRVMDGHIEVDDKGVPRIAGTRVKIIHLVMGKIANHWGADELQHQFPHFSLSRIHAALSYYYDHQSEMDAQVRASVEQAERMHHDAPPEST